MVPWTTTASAVHRSTMDRGRKAVAQLVRVACAGDSGHLDSLQQFLERERCEEPHRGRETTEQRWSHAGIYLEGRQWFNARWWGPTNSGSSLWLPKLKEGVKAVLTVDFNGDE
jgi:hypothetical protein